MINQNMQFTNNGGNSQNTMSNETFQNIMNGGNMQNNMSSGNMQNNMNSNNNFQNNMTSSMQTINSNTNQGFNVLPSGTNNIPQGLSSQNTFNVQNGITSGQLDRLRIQARQGLNNGAIQFRRGF